MVSKYVKIQGGKLVKVKPWVKVYLLIALSKSRNQAESDVEEMEQYESDGGGF